MILAGTRINWVSTEAQMFLLLTYKMNVLTALRTFIPDISINDTVVKSRINVWRSIFGTWMLFGRSSLQFTSMGKSSGGSSNSSILLLCSSSSSDISMSFDVGTKPFFRVNFKNNFVLIVLYMYCIVFVLVDHSFYK